MDRIELPVPKRVMSDVDVVANGLNAESGTEIVPAFQPRQVIGELRRRVPDAVASCGAEAARRIRREGKFGNRQRAGVLAWEETERLIGYHRPVRLDIDIPRS